MTVNNLPTSGKTIYVRMYSLINGVWQYNDYTYTTPSTASAVLSSPSQGTIITTSSVTFTWTPGVGVSTYALQYLGSYAWRNRHLQIAEFVYHISDR